MDYKTKRLFLERLSESLKSVGSLEGVESAHGDDEVGVSGAYFDNYLVVTYLAQLIDRGEMKLEIREDRLPYLLKLLKMEGD